MGEDLTVQPGTLLAAWPDLLDPNFMHSVLVICQHSDEGAYGLVTNRETEFAVKDILPEHPTLGRSDFPVFVGGPVDQATMQFLHTVPKEIPDGFCLDGQLWLGGDLDALGHYLLRKEDEARGCVRILLGYSGWGSGQLDAELLTGSWLPAATSLEAIFGEPGEGTWRRVVRSIEGGGEALADLPPDVSWN